MQLRNFDTVSLSRRRSPRRERAINSRGFLPFFSFRQTRLPTRKFKRGNSVNGIEAGARCIASLLRPVSLFLSFSLTLSLFFFFFLRPCRPASHACSRQDVRIRQDRTPLVGGHAHAPATHPFRVAFVEPLREHERTTGRKFRAHAEQARGGTAERRKRAIQPPRAYFTVKEVKGEAFGKNERRRRATRRSN